MATTSSDRQRLIERIASSEWAGSGDAGGSLADVVTEAPTFDLSLSDVAPPSVRAVARATRNALLAPSQQLRRTAAFWARDQGGVGPDRWASLGQRAAAGAALEQLARSGPVGETAVALLGTVAPGLPADLAAEVLATQPGPPMGASTVRQRVAAAFGPGMIRVDDVPLGTTTVTQLHHAEHRDGRHLLVVVTKPGVGRAVHDDVRSLAPLSLLLDAALPALLPSSARSLSLPLLESLAAQLLTRCDQRLVAVDAIELGLLVEDRSIDGIQVARPIPGLVTRSACAFELPDGLDVTQPPAPSSQLVVQGLLGVTLETAFSTGVHAAALDPAHLLVASSGGLVVAGGTTVGRLSGDTRRGLAKAGSGLMAGDGASLVEALVLAGIFPESADREVLASLLESAGLSSLAAFMGGERPSSGAIRSTAITLLTRHQARPTPEVSTFLLAILQAVTSMRVVAPSLSSAELAMHALPRLMVSFSTVDDND